MFLILISWLYILIVSSVIGISINKVLSLKKQDGILTLFFGFFGVTLLTGFWAIPFAVNSIFQITLFVLILILGVLLKERLLHFWLNIVSEIKQLSLFLKIVLLTITVLIIAQCASPPFVIDNESYYVQTIKWLNEYGFVNGLVNLHMFLGQTSGWHILQSAFSFSFLYDRFNDISGLALLLGNTYAILKLNLFISKKEASNLNLAIGLFPLWNVFFFQFISAPSPDIAIYVLSIIVLHQFIICYIKYTKQSFLAVVMLSLFIALIKLTGLVFCIFPLILYKRYYLFTRSRTSIIVLFGSASLLLFAIKNLIITGNLLFPFEGFDALKTVWSLPESIEVYFANYMQPYSYHLSSEAFENASILLRLKAWFFAPLPHGLFNPLMIVLLVILPIIIRKYYNNKAIWIIYGVAIINMLVLFMSSPQYRFFFPFILCFTLLISALVISNRRLIKLVLVSFTLVTIIPLFFEVNTNQITDNKYHQVTSKFSFDYLIQPYKNSKYSEDFDVLELNETIINTPKHIDFFWGTGNLPLPAVNREQLNYFQSYFKAIPQQRTEDLKDGFYSEILN